ncbi:MAG: DUF5331 domain-containing protein [Elainellaceae cyanobacterium]
MNVEQLRTSLKLKWLSYYRENRIWLVRLGVWINYDGQRRPSSSFILATLSVLEPRLTQILPLIVDLNSNPDQVVFALGLNFSPDDELDALAAHHEPASDDIKMLPSHSLNASPLGDAESKNPSQVAAKVDESCQGVQGQVRDDLRPHHR